MKTIEQLANEFMSAYNSADKEVTLRKADLLMKSIKKDEWQFTKVEHTYEVARSMYYLLKVEKELSNYDYETIVRLIYYCLLKNYAQNSDVISTDVKYKDLISGCELAFIVMCRNGQFLMYRLLSGALGYMPNFTQKHIVDQMLLFGGIVKDAYDNDYHYFIDRDISNSFSSLLQEVYENIPPSEELQSYKDNCMSVIKTIFKELENGFHYEDDLELF